MSREGAQGGSLDPVTEIAQIVADCRAVHVERLAKMDSKLSDAITGMIATADRTEAVLTRLEQSVTSNKSKLERVEGVLAGDTLHPNGVQTKLKELEAEQVEIRRMVDKAKGFIIGAGLGAGAAGGSVVWGLEKLLGG